MTKAWIWTLVAIGVGLIALVAYESSQNFLEYPRSGSHETNAIGCLMAFRLAQEEYKAKNYSQLNGRGPNLYAESFGQLSNDKGQDGKPIYLLNPKLADAHPEGTPFLGYLFTWVKKRDGKALDSAKDYALCAYPDVHGRSGNNVYVISSGNEVRMRDNNGKPILDLIHPGTGGVKRPLRPRGKPHGPGRRCRAPARRSRRGGSPNGCRPARAG